jgi:hypothetical protein
MLWSWNAFRSCTSGSAPEVSLQEKTGYTSAYDNMGRQTGTVRVSAGENVHAINVYDAASNRTLLQTEPVGYLPRKFAETGSRHDTL